MFLHLYNKGHPLSPSKYDVGNGQPCINLRHAACCNLQSLATAFAESFRLRAFINLRDVYPIRRRFALNRICKLDDMSINLIEHTGRNGQESLVWQVIRPQPEHAYRLEERSQAHHPLLRIEVCI